MHLDTKRGRTARRIAIDGWKIDRTIPWPATGNPFELARSTGKAMGLLAAAFGDLRPDIVLVAGDRVEAFAAASAAHIAGCVVAHVHGGDRALGQVDDSLRHAITKLSHVHFAATRQSARRLARLGEDRWRIHPVGAPGLDGIHPVERSVRDKSALIVLHPVDADPRIEFVRARTVLRAVQSIAFQRIGIVYPNNDPGADGIVQCWREHARGDRIAVFADLPRATFLQLLGRAAVLVGNSSSGIIEAASLGTPVVDIGPRQRGRERSRNVTTVPYSLPAIRRALVRIWRRGRPRRFSGTNVYGAGGAGAKIARILASIPLEARIRRKLIAY
jgi:UDP-N-acetylglucosamine 2-epimerase (non-hydrolysing)/GDP/UDP-N,N'-diacetylbacillosamine 2-epimerase (hydrolysing)